MINSICENDKLDDKTQVGSAFSAKKFNCEAEFW